jgi:hypothetical protein
MGGLLCMNFFPKYWWRNPQSLNPRVTLGFNIIESYGISQYPRFQMTKDSGTGDVSCFCNI